MNVAAVERTVCRTCGRSFSQGERFCPFDRTELGSERPAGGDPLLGTIVAGSYTLLDRLGTGGMGVVYRARQNRLERNVALKMLSPRLGADREAEERFRKEALAVSQLSNPHTVAIHDFGSTADGMLYLVMHLVEGESLRARLGRGPLDFRTAILIAAQICESLAEAHDRSPQIVHRDIKPDNIFVRRTSEGEDFVTVLDFGLAKLADSERMTASGYIVGTPAYMAPEQAQAEGKLDGRVDLYALGAMLHEMVVGRPPFTAPNPTAVLYKQVFEAPPSLSAVRPDLRAPPELEKLVLSMLDKDPEKRPATASIVRGRLLEILRTMPGTEAPVISVQQPPVIVPAATIAYTPEVPPGTPALPMSAVSESIPPRRSWGRTGALAAAAVAVIALLAWAFAGRQDKKADEPAPVLATPPVIAAHAPPPPAPVPAPSAVAMHAAEPPAPAAAAPAEPAHPAPGSDEPAKRPARRHRSHQPRQKSGDEDFPVIQD
jgi:serine/threonine-protein kinase